MTATQIPMSPRYNGTELTTDLVIRVKSRYNSNRATRLGVGAVPADQAARKVFQGPLVQGPWAYTYPLSTVISAHPQAPETIIEAQIGDRFEIDGVEYVLTDDNRWDYPAMTPVA